MSLQAVESFLDADAVPVRKNAFIHAWISPAARDNHIQQIELLSSLFSVLADAFTRSGLQLNKPSGLQRIDNNDLPDLGFWICRPSPNGPTCMLIVQRANEMRAWQPQLEQMIAAE